MGLRKKWRMENWRTALGNDIRGALDSKVEVEVEAGQNLFARDLEEVVVPNLFVQILEVEAVELNQFVQIVEEVVGLNLFVHDLEEEVVAVGLNLFVQVLEEVEVD